MFRVILLCLLTCCSSFMPLKHSESIISEDHTQVVEQKTKRDYVKTSSGYYEFGASDLFAYDFLEGLINYYVNDLNVPNAAANNQPLNNYVIQTSGIYKVFYFYAHTNPVETGYQSIFNVSNIVLNKTIVINDTPAIIEYDLIFSNSSPYDRQVHIIWNAQRTIDQMGLTIWGVHMDVSDALKSLHNVIYWPMGFMLSELAGGYNAFIGNIWNSIHSDPYNAGYNTGFDNGLQNGREVGERIGYQNGYAEGEVAGYTTGYNTGVSDTIASGSEAMTIFAGIMDVAFIPVNVFFLMFDYEVFGINIAGFVSGLLTIAIVIILMRFIFGRRV